MDGTIQATLIARKKDSFTTVHAYFERGEHELKCANIRIKSQLK